MKNKSINTEALKKRIEAMKQSKMPMAVKMAEMTEQLMKMGGKRNE